MARTLNQLIGGIPMTATAQTVKRGIPDVLPESFRRVNRRVIGNSVQYKKVAGNRSLARLAQYGAPSRLTGQTGISLASAVMLHSFEHQTHNPLVLQNLQSGDGAAQDMAREELDRQNGDFAEQFNSLRTVSIYSMLANGAIWADSEGSLQSTSSGAVTSVDASVPATHKNQLNGIIGASWATASTDIMGHIVAIKKAAQQETQYPIMHAFYGTNIPGYLANNTTIKGYLNAAPSLAQALYSGGEIGAGFAGIQWHPVYNAHYVNSSGTIVEPFTADTVVFTPEPSPDWWEVVEGSYMVPRRIDVTDTALAAMGNLETVFGKFGYAVPTHDPVGITQYGGDTFLPLLKVGAAIWIADVTP